MAGSSRAALLEELRARVAPPGRTATLPFGIAAIDAALPRGGLAQGAVHEAAGTGPDLRHRTAPALLAAAVLARAGGPVLWASARFDLSTPALAKVGPGPERVLHLEAGYEVQAAMEEGLHHPGLAGVVGEVPGRLGLTASRRLQLAAEATGAIAFALRRPIHPDDPALAEPADSNDASRGFRLKPATRSS